MGPRHHGWEPEAPRDLPFSIIESRVSPGLDGFKTIVFFNAKLVEALLEAGLDGPRHLRKVVKSIVFTMQKLSRPESRPASTSLEVSKTYRFFNIHCLEAGLK